MTKYLLLSTVVLLTIGCGTLPQAKKASNKSNLVGSEVGLSSEKIIRDLKRANLEGLAVQNVNYVVEAYPLTEPLLRTEQSELCKKNMDSADDCKRKIDLVLSKYFTNQSCFRVNIDAMTIDLAKFENWRVKLKTSDKDLMEGNFSEGLLIPKLGISQARPYNNFGMVCFRARIDYGKGFDFHAIPQFNGGDFQKVELGWN